MSHATWPPDRRELIFSVNSLFRQLRNKGLFSLVRSSLYIRRGADWSPKNLKKRENEIIEIMGFEFLDSYHRH